MVGYVDQYLSPWYRLKEPGVTELQQCLHQTGLWTTLWAFPWLLTGVGSRPLGEHRLYKEADWANCGEQIRFSWSAQASTSNSHLGFLWWWTKTCKPNKHAPPQSWFLLMFYHSNKNKIKTLRCTASETINQVKKKPIECERIFARYSSDRVLIYRIYKAWSNKKVDYVSEQRFCKRRNQNG